MQEDIKNQLETQSDSPLPDAETFLKQGTHFDELFNKYKHQYKNLAEVYRQRAIRHYEQALSLNSVSDSPPIWPPQITATTSSLRKLYPEGRFSSRSFALLQQYFQYKEIFLGWDKFTENKVIYIDQKQMHAQWKQLLNTSKNPEIAENLLEVYELFGPPGRHSEVVQLEFTEKKQLLTLVEECIFMLPSWRQQQALEVHIEQINHKFNTYQADLMIAKFKKTKNPGILIQLGKFYIKLHSAAKPGFFQRVYRDQLLFWFAVGLRQTSYLLPDKDSSDKFIEYTENAFYYSRNEPENRKFIEDLVKENPNISNIKAVSGDYGKHRLMGGLPLSAKAIPESKAPSIPRSKSFS